MTGPGASPRSADRGKVIFSMMTLGFGSADNMLHFILDCSSIHFFGSEGVTGEGSVGKDSPRCDFMGTGGSSPRVSL